MKNKKQLTNEYEIKLKKMNEQCKHQKVTEIHDRCAATGEWIEFSMKTCDICGTILDRKTWCADCNKEIHNEELMKFWGFELCPDCHKNKDTFFERLFARKKRSI